MKQTLLIITALMLVVGCSSDPGSTLVSKNGLMYAPGSDKPYSGLHTLWYENGQKSLEQIYKDGEQDGLFTKWHENGQKSGEGTWKDSNRIEESFTYWDRDGNKK